MVAISGLVITYNESGRIADCLEALHQVCEEIIVVDSFSEDNTVEICSAYPGVKVIRQAWLGYGQQKNFGAARATHDHILSVDADEVLSPELIRSIREIKQGELPPVLWLNRLNNYYGEFYHHGLESPDHKPRLYNRVIARWNASPVHEELEMPTGTPKRLLDGFLWHYTVSSIEEHLAKQNQYTSLAAEKLYSKGKKPSVLKMLFSPLMRFLRAYFIKAGFRDGKKGLVLCLIHANASFQRQVKLWQLHNRRKTS